MSLREERKHGLRDLEKFCVALADDQLDGHGERREMFPHRRHDSGAETLHGEGQLKGVVRKTLRPLIVSLRLRQFHLALESEVPHLDEVTSLTNVRSTYGRGDELVVEDLLERFPATPEELAAQAEWREKIATSLTQKGM